MMTYDQAFAAMKVGGRVRRKSWDDHERFVRFDGKPLDEMGYQWLPRHTDIEADDWEMLQ